MKKAFRAVCVAVLFCGIVVLLNSCGKPKAVLPENGPVETAVAVSDVPSAVTRIETVGTAPAAKAAATVIPPGVEAVVSSFLAQALLSDLDTLGKLAADAEAAGVADVLAAALEKQAALPDAPPSVHVALSALYGRKGFRTKEYAALVMAEEAAKQPGVKFNIALVHGRKKLLDGSPDAAGFIVGIFDLATDPPGAAVFLDGKPSGSTPVVLEKIKAGPHTLRFELSGYDAHSVDAELVVGRTFSVTKNLVPKPSFLSLKVSPADADVKIDGAVVSAGNAISLAPGNHALLIEEQNGKTITDTLIIKPGETLSRSYTMEPAVFNWRFNSVPAGGVISLDGKEIGVAPIVDYPVVAGMHQVTVKMDKYEVLTETRHFYGDKNPNVLVENFLLVKGPFQIPTKTIRLKNREDWDGVEPVDGKALQDDMLPDIAGTKVSRVVMAQDKQYVYWLMEFADGTPSAKAGVCYSITFDMVPGNYLKNIALKLGSNGNPGTFQPHLPYNPPGPVNQWTDMWNNGGSASDYAVGPGYITARFPRSSILKAIKAGTVYRMSLGTYLDTKKGENWCGFNISKAML